MTAPTRRIDWLGPNDVDLLVAASVLFDDTVTRSGAERFLSRPGHHLALASVAGEAVGFVSVIEVDHPDKAGSEFLLYELGVDERHRRQGHARALVDAALARAVATGCRGAWVVTDRSNSAAMATYRSAGAAEAPGAVDVVFDWSF